MIKRKIIKIDESKCDGCALCIPSCPEGALQIIGGKVKLVKESFCDGLGACLGDCPQNALTVVEALVDEYDGEGVIEHIKTNTPEKLEAHLRHLNEHSDELQTHGHNNFTGGCPSARVAHWDSVPVPVNIRTESHLCQWPIQLHLVPPHAQYFMNSDLVLAADCVPFAYANFHSDFLNGHTVAIACPKLDDTSPYHKKLQDIITYSNIKSLKVIIMEVPCCSGLFKMAKEVLQNTSRTIPLELIVIGIKGNVLRRQNFYTEIES